jgi:hypothetical protein
VPRSERNGSVKPDKGVQLSDGELDTKVDRVLDGDEEDKGK